MSEVAPPAESQPAPHASGPAPDAPAAAPEPAQAAPRSTLANPWGHGIVALLALVGIVVNVIGGIGFPPAAPVEWLMNAGITIDLVAVLIACGIGFRPSRRKEPVRPSVVFPWLGLGGAALAAFAWVMFAGGLFETLFAGGRGRYMEDVSGAFMLGFAWSLGAIFSAYGLRRGGPARLAIASWAGIVLWAIVLVGVLTSAIIYAMDLTD